MSGNWEVGKNLGVSMLYPVLCCGYYHSRLSMGERVLELGLLVVRFLQYFSALWQSVARLFL